MHIRPGLLQNFNVQGVSTTHTTMHAGIHQLHYVIPVLLLCEDEHKDIVAQRMRY